MLNDGVYQYPPFGINRIRLEFKGARPVIKSASAVTVLIESDWNLKQEGENAIQMALRVLIESDWNLKFLTPEEADEEIDVLIESDWNLKETFYISLSLCPYVLIESDWNLKTFVWNKVTNQNEY